MELNGKSVIITGSSSGIGAATAKLCASKGAKVAINYSKSAEEGEKVAEECRALGGETILVQGNVSEDEDCKRIVQTVVDAFGGVDLLVNNAGTTKFNGHANLDGLDKDDFLNIYSVNLVGPYQMIRACAPFMKEAGFGSVINVSSIAGVKGIGSSVAYAASKGALNTMTMSLGRALGPEIRVNAICPGFVGTEWFVKSLGQEMFDAIKAQQEEATPLKRAGTAEDIAQAIVSLAQASDHITGETLLVDAGLHLGTA